MIKFEELTLGEIEEIENLLGRGIDEAFADGKPKGRALRVFYFIAKRRSEPNYKFEDTAKITQQQAIEFVTGAADPKE